MVTKEVYKTREEWLQARGRQPVIGGSDIGTILGLNPYCTPYQYWLGLQQQEEVSEQEENRMYRGNFMEDGIARWFEQRTGEKVIKNTRQITVYRNSKYPDFIQVAPDRELFQRGREKRPILEIKDTRFSLDSLSLDSLSLDSLPKEWFAQLQYQMGVMERNSGYLAICDGSKELQYNSFAFDAEYFNTIVNFAIDWYNRYIIGDEVPDPQTGEDVVLMFPDSEDVAKQVPLSVFEIASELKQTKEKIKKLSLRQNELENSLKVHFEENDSLEYEGTKFASFKTQTRKSIDTDTLTKEMPEIAAKYVKETKFRTLRLSK